MRCKIARCEPNIATIAKLRKYEIYVTFLTPFFSRLVFTLSAALGASVGVTGPRNYQTSYKTSYTVFKNLLYKNLLAKLKTIKFRGGFACILF